MPLPTMLHRHESLRTIAENRGKLETKQAILSHMKRLQTINETINEERLNKGLDLIEDPEVMIAKITEKVHDRLCKSTIDLKTNVDDGPKYPSQDLVSNNIRSSRSEIASI